MQNIKDTVWDVMRKLETKQSKSETEAFELLKKNLSPKERLHIRCVSLREGIITVNVDSSVWLYQLSQKKDKIVDKLGIKDIRFRIGEVNTVRKGAVN